VDESESSVFPSLHHRKEGNTLDSDSFTPVDRRYSLKIKLYTQLGEPGRDDRKRRQPGRAKRLLIAVGDA